MPSFCLSEAYQTTLLRDHGVTMQWRRTKMPVSLVKKVAKGMLESYKSRGVESDWEGEGVHR